MWQSQIEIDVTYFEHITEFEHYSTELLLGREGGGLICDV